ncbi:MAG TPA: aldo/keto reductase [Solirubrobacteraceae bacterium]|nr:aldo/keto reductase [Solirubrobacteraceae bacterium]
MTTNSNMVPEIALNDGAVIPQLGFGVWQIPQAAAAGVVAEALRVGYRHIDTAQLYGNEQGVGEAVLNSGLAREEVFVTTKCRNDAHGHAGAVRELENSLERLGLDQVDLYLIHWPQPSLNLYVETWEGLIEARERGLTRSIGVSNFHAPHLERIISATGVAPAVNQIELHPRLTQEPLVAANRALGIQVEGWSPLANGQILDEQSLQQIAAVHGRSVAQVVIRWHLQLGYIAIPRSARPARMAANFDVFDFELAPEELHRISALNRDSRTGGNPDDF